MAFVPWNVLRAHSSSFLTLTSAAAACGCSRTMLATSCGLYAVFVLFRHFVSPSVKSLRPNVMVNPILDLNLFRRSSVRYLLRNLTWESSKSAVLLNNRPARALFQCSQRTSNAPAYCCRSTETHFFDGARFAFFFFPRIPDVLPYICAPRSRYCRGKLTFFLCVFFFVCFFVCVDRLINSKLIETSTC